MNVSKKFAKVQEKIRFTFTAKSSSTVFLLGVDRSVNLLMSPNDITEKKVMFDLNSYNAYKNYEVLDIEGIEDKRYQDVGTSNAFFITNAYEGKRKGCPNLKKAENGESVSDEDSDDTILSQAVNPDDSETFTSKTRKDFPETWLFNEVQIKEDGTAYIEENLPDTITAWDVSAFAIHKDSGLGVAKTARVSVSEQFFLRLYMPYSIRIGEILRIDVNVFSYIDKQKDFLDVNVTLFNENLKPIGGTPSIVPPSDDTDDSDPFNAAFDEKVEEENASFDFYTAERSSGSCTYKKSEADNNNKKSVTSIKVSRKSGEKTHFFIKAIRAGTISFKVRAEFKLAGKPYYDEVVKTLKIEPEGITKSENHAFLIDLSKFNQTSYEFPIVKKTKAVKDSIRLTTSIVGDLIGPAVQSVENLM